MKPIKASDVDLAEPILETYQLLRLVGIDPTLLIPYAVIVLDERTERQDIVGVWYGTTENFESGQELLRRQVRQVNQNFSLTLVPLEV